MRRYLPCLILGLIAIAPFLFLQFHSGSGGQAETVPPTVPSPTAPAIGVSVVFSHDISEMRKFSDVKATFIAIVEAGVDRIGSGVPVEWGANPECAITQLTASDIAVIERLYPEQCR